MLCPTLNRRFGPKAEVRGVEAAPDCYNQAAVRGLARCVELGSPIGSGGKHGP